ncbi:MAG: hypothetical protein Q4C49_01870 [Bacillota bacterium]|nr:hypothetical protein [Bacillota bacterium]
MTVEYRVESKDSQISIIAYENGIEIGSVQALSDGHAWAILHDVNASSEDVEKGLIEKATNLLKGQEIFTTVSSDQLDTYENQGFFR